MKDNLANKKRLTEYEIISFNRECISRIQNRLPIKFNDSGSFTMQITIGKSIHAKGLCNLKANINLMPTSLYKNWGWEFLSPPQSFCSLQIAALLGQKVLRNMC